MPPSKRSRNPSKRFAKINEEAFCKDGKNSNKSRVRKRNLSDMIGSQWSTEELEQFYDSYRKYGKDWKKVTSTLPNRTSDMVEALYTMNTAYLSLPEGKATAAGLIAMMCDHYDMLEGSDSDRESNDVPQMSRKPHKRSRGKFRLISKGVNETSAYQFQHKSAGANFGCLSLLKRKRSGDVLAIRGPRVVGKRTPRIAVSSMCLKDERPCSFSPTKDVPKSEAISTEDHLHAALALTEASHRAGSPQVSRTPSRIIKYIKSSPTQSTGKKNGKSKMINSLFLEDQLDDDFPEGSLESREADNANYTRGISRALKNQNSCAIEAEERIAKVQRKPMRMRRYENDHFDDEKEACSGTEGGPSTRKSKEEMDGEIPDKNSLRSSKFLRKTSRQLYFGDESSGLDALQTLADLSLNILRPSSTVESESSILVKEEHKSVDEKQSIAESFPTIEKKVRQRIYRKREKVSTCCDGADAVKCSSSKPEKNKHHVTSTTNSKLQVGFSGSKTVKRKPKTLSQTISTYDSGNDCNEDSQKKKVATDEGKKPVTKAKRTSQVTSSQKHGKLVKSSEHSSSSTDVGRTVAESAETTINVGRTNQTNLPNRSSSRRKINLQKSLDIWDMKPMEIAADECPAKYSHLNHEKKKLSHCLSSRLLRRWCIFEWFYSAIDHPWFDQSEFNCYLKHVQLNHIPTLTRVEWSVIRSSLGKPRRLSKQFLQEEREKLEQYHESVQAHYADLRAGIREGLPADLARPLTVGQRVISCYPKTREIHDGSVLTVDHSRCRVQFDRPELGVEFVMDKDCMPLNPSENEALQRTEVLNKYPSSLSDAKLDQSEWKSGISMRHTLIGGSDISERSSHDTMNTLMKQAKGDTIDAIVQAKTTADEVTAATQQSMHNQPCTLAQLQAREEDIRALAELTRSLDKKQALLTELRNMNEDVSAKQNGSGSLEDLERFRKHYATVLLQLKDANVQVASALAYLRQRNTYHENSQPPLFSPEECSNGPAVGSGTLSTAAFLGLNSGSHIAEIVENSRRSARNMIGVAVEEIYCLREGEDVFAKITDGLTCANNLNFGSASSTRGPTHFTDSVNGSLFQQVLTTSSTSEQAPCNSVIHTSKSNDTQFPLELISSCVASLLMIQNCTEKQYPPGELAQILDVAVTSLLPCAQQNLSLYREIETCVGIIKNQMLALVPTRNSIHPDTSIM